MPDWLRDLITHTHTHTVSYMVNVSRRVWELLHSNRRHFAILLGGEGPIGAKKCCGCMLICTDVDFVGPLKYRLEDSSISLSD